MRVTGHRSRTTTWWWISPVRISGVRWLWWSGKSTKPREASLRWVGAPGPVEEESERLVRFGDGEPVAKTGVEVVASFCIRTTGGRTGQQRWQHARVRRWDNLALHRGGAHTCCRPQRGCQRQRPHVRATPSGLCPYATVQAELARVLDAEATCDEERCASSPCLRGYTWAKA
jgi:hypothetical protein